MKTCKTNIFQACPLVFYLSPPFVLIVLYLFLSWLLDFFGWDVLWRMEKITFIFGISNIQNILTLRQFPSQIRRKSWGGGETLNETFFFFPLFLQQNVTWNNQDVFGVLFLLAYLLRISKRMKCWETWREGSSGRWDAIFWGAPS